MPTGDSLRRVADEFRASNAVVVIGAGASIHAGYPLTDHLRPLLWHAIDRAPGAAAQLAAQLGRPLAPTKDLVGDDPAAIAAAFAMLRHDAAARGAFQEAFASLDAERTRTFSPAHDAIAELLHRRAIETVISLNWDTMIEAAYLRRYGARLTADDAWLYKLHGDAARPDTPWRYPTDAGHVPSSLIERLRALATDRPRLLMVVGYSERDETVVRDLIRPLESQWRVVRIAPDATGDLFIGLPADEALPRLRELVVQGRFEEVPGWHYVTFASQHDLGSALDGRGLGPADVVACPRLPEVATTHAALVAAHSVTVAGKPGSGKSMVAHHVAADLSDAGWEVLRWTGGAQQRTAQMAPLPLPPRRSLLLIDDAQTLDPAFLRRLAEHATSERRVVIVTNDEEGDERGMVRVSGERAVKHLASALLERRADTLAALQRIDDRVDDRRFDVSLEDRVELAAEVSKSPWQFAFVLTRGERRAREHVDALRTDNRADLLLAIIGVRQLLTRDAGATDEELTTLARSLDRDRAWVDDSLVRLQRRRLLADGDQRRLPHLAFAQESLRVMLGHQGDPARPQLFAMIRAACLLSVPPLSGLAFMLRDMWFGTGLLAVRGSWAVLDAATWRVLEARIVAAQTAADRSGAAYLLEALRSHVPELDLWLSEHVSLLTEWVSEATAESAYGLHTLLNDLINNNKPLVAKVAASVPPEALAERVSMAPLAEAYAWRALMGRLAFADLPWRQAFGAALAHESLLQKAREASAIDAKYICALAELALPFDRALAIDLIEAAAPALARFIEADVLEAAGWYSAAFRFVLGFAEEFFRYPEPDERQRAVAAALWRHVDAGRVAARLSRVSRRELSEAGSLLIRLREMAPETWRTVVQQLDFSALSMLTTHLWAHNGGELEEFIVGVADLEHPEATGGASWVARHVPDMRIIPERVVAYATDEAVAAARAGAEIRFDFGSFSTWGLETYIFAAIADRDPALVSQLIDAHAPRLRQELLLTRADQCEYLSEFLTLLREVAPDALLRVVEGVDLDKAEQHWSARLQGSEVERAGARMLVEVASGVNGSVADLATRLTARRDIQSV